MSLPVSPSSSRRRPLYQAFATDGENTGTGSWLDAISGVMNDLLQSWGIIGAFRRRGWGTGGTRSTPSTPPPVNREASSNHEHIELSHLNIQCRKNVDGGGSSEECRIGSPENKVKRRPKRFCDRTPRHSFHEGSSPHSYLLTTLLIHSLKYGSGQSCLERHCHLCLTPKSFTSNIKVEDHSSVLLDSKQWKNLGPDHYALFNRSISVTSSCNNKNDAFEQDLYLPFSQDRPLNNENAYLSSYASNSQVSDSCKNDSTCPDLSCYDDISFTNVTYSSRMPNTTSVSHKDSLVSFSESYKTAKTDHLGSTDSTSCKETDASDFLFTNTGTLTDFLTGKTCCTSSFFGDVSYESATLTGDGFDLPNDDESLVSKQNIFHHDLSSSVYSLPCRLGYKNEANFGRPLLNSGSLVLIHRRASLSSPIGTPSAPHFCWEENPCYLRIEGMRPGQGHDFRATTLERPAWCDACAHLVFYHATACSNCNLTCHEQCQNVVSLDCKLISPDQDFNRAKRASSPSLFQEDNEGLKIEDDVYLLKEELNKEVQEDELEEEEEDEDIKEVEEEKYEEEILEKDIIQENESNVTDNKQEFLNVISQHLEVSTLKRTVRRIQSQAVDSAKIEEWVQKCPINNVGLQITKEEDGGYRGCLRIHLNLSRPINIVAGTRPPSIYDIMQEDRTLEKTLTSFYMPRDTVKAIHITSKTTTREVIVALLRKFKVVDNPQKFALYERTYDAGQSMKAKLRRLGDNECPLVLAIAWNAENITNKRLVLQENDTADIQWEAFSLPELDNFLRILDREEGEYKNQIRDKYSLLRQRIQMQLSRLPNTEKR